MRFLLKESYAEKKRIKLSVKDKKLIQLLIQDGRASVSELAKKVGISKSAVVQKINSLTNKGVLLDPVLYTNVNLPVNKDFYTYHIKTQLGMNRKTVNDKLLAIDGMVAVLWYNGNFDLILVSSGEDSNKMIEEIDKIVPIKKLRVQKVIGTWFHPPHIFDEIKDVEAEFERVSPNVTKLDEKILLYLHEKPRASLVDISGKVKSSPTTVKKRINEMKKNGAIVSFSNYVNFWLVERDLVSVSFIVKGQKNTDNLIKKLLNFPQVGNVWEFDHEWNVNAVFWVKDQVDVNRILESVSKKCEGILDTEIMSLVGMVGK